MEAQTKTILRWLILPLTLLTAIVYIAAFQTQPDFKLHAYFYDNFFLVKTYTDRKIIIDGGSDDKILSKIGNQLSFYDHSIDLLILTILPPCSIV